MRGGDVRTEALFSDVSCEGRVPKDHPLRRIVEAALGDLPADLAKLDAPIGRPSIPPEKLLRALLLQALYSVRSERQLMAQLDYNLRFRGFVDLGIEDPVGDVTVFTKNRDRLLEGDIAAKVFQAVLGRPEVKALVSDQPLSVDGALIEAFDSMKSSRPKDEGDDGPPANSDSGEAGSAQGRNQEARSASARPGRNQEARSASARPGRNQERNFHGERRKNDTHASSTDPDARLFRNGRGKKAKLCHMGHLLMEKRLLLARVWIRVATEAAGR